MTDTWDDIQAFKKRQHSLREKFQKRKKEREEIVQSLVTDFAPTSTMTIPSTSTVMGGSGLPNLQSTLTKSSESAGATSGTSTVLCSGNAHIISQAPNSETSTACPTSDQRHPQKLRDVGISAVMAAKTTTTTAVGTTTTTAAAAADDESASAKPTVERRLLQCLCDLALNGLPTDSRALLSSINKALGLQSDVTSHIVLENLLQKFAAQEMITIKEGFSAEGKICILIVGAEHTKITAVANEMDAVSEAGLFKESTISSFDAKEETSTGKPSSSISKKESISRGTKIPAKNSESIESLLSLPSTREKESKKMGEEILDLLSKPTAKEKSIAERFRSQGGAQVQEFCPHGTKEECVKLGGDPLIPCHKLHFKKIIQKHTDESLGDCSFLNTCFHMDTCKYVHYEVDHSSIASAQEKNTKPEEDKENVNLSAENKHLATLYPPQWIQCDLRYFDMTILGKFAVVMADPPWDIHMELPYGTMSDNEMRQLNIPTLQEEGLIFLWVTGRAMELGRECLKLWGYERCDEIIWVKTNQLQRIIRTGRTGHWLNHGKEHCLVGMKGDAASINRGLDCDVIVAEVRATSHKPDEIYGIIERLSPGTRKIELFGRPHNIQPNWITLGNQVDGVRLIDPEIVQRFQERYPDGNCMVPPTLATKT